MSAVGKSYTDAEILAFSRMSWWEYAAGEGLPTSVGRRASERIERGHGSYVARRKPARDFLSEPIDWLAMPLDYLQRETEMPELITDTILVVEAFRSGDMEYRRGDRVPTRHRAIRRIAAASPHLFAMEYGTEPLDLEWLASIEADAEGRYEAVKRLREAEKGQRERALREEMKEQERGQPELERRFKKQEDEREKREQEVLREREREELEREIAFTSDLRSGFNF
jgi:hypothetical protein